MGSNLAVAALCGHPVEMLGGSPDLTFAGELDHPGADQLGDVFPLPRGNFEHELVVHLEQQPRCQTGVAQVVSPGAYTEKVTVPPSVGCPPDKCAVS